MSDIISIRECLDIMHSGKPFSCVVYTYDRKRKTGGEIREYPEAVLLGNEEKSEKQDRPLTRMEGIKQKLAEPEKVKNPNHKHWYTRNIRILQDGHPTGIIVKLHPPLLKKFNNKTVVP